MKNFFSNLFNSQWMPVVYDELSTLLHAFNSEQKAQFRKLTDGKTYMAKRITSKGVKTAYLKLKGYSGRFHCSVFKDKNGEEFF